MYCPSGENTESAQCAITHTVSGVRPAGRYFAPTTIDIWDHHGWIFSVVDRKLSVGWNCCPNSLSRCERWYCLGFDRNPEKHLSSRYCLCVPQLLNKRLLHLVNAGMAYENIHPTSPDRAIQAYNVALPLITNLLNDFIPQTTRTSPASSVPSSTSFLAFTQHRELWRWVEAIIWRSACLLSRVSPVHDEDDLGMLWSWVKQYTLCTTIWPPDFRTQHRSTISVLYLRALVLRAQGRGPSSPTFNDAQQRHPYRDGHLEESQEWMLSARSLVNSYRAILSVSTKFPVAGQTNVKVEDFVDLCVAVWEAGGSAPDQAAWVTDVSFARLTYVPGSLYLGSTRSSGGQRVSLSTPLASYVTCPAFSTHRATSLSPSALCRCTCKWYPKDSWPTIPGLTRRLTPMSTGS